MKSNYPLFLHLVLKLLVLTLVLGTFINKCSSVRGFLLERYDMRRFLQCNIRSQEHEPSWLRNNFAIVLFISLIYQNKKLLLNDMRLAMNPFAYLPIDQLVLMPLHKMEMGRLVLHGREKPSHTLLNTRKKMVKIDEALSVALKLAKETQTHNVIDFEHTSTSSLPPSKCDSPLSSLPRPTWDWQWYSVQEHTQPLRTHASSCLEPSILVNHLV